MHPIYAFGTEIVRPDIIENSQGAKEKSENSNEIVDNKEEKNEEVTDNTESVFDVSDLSKDMINSTPTKTTTNDSRMEGRRGTVKFVDVQDDKLIDKLISPKKKTTKKSGMKGKLPQTGEELMIWIAWLGVIALAINNYLIKKRIKGGDGY